VFGALVVRQSYSILDKNKTLVLLLFAAIVLTCGYESIISSDIIVPPPVLVARRLKDLVDAGYGILGYHNDSYSATILLTLKRENIPYSSLNEQPFIPNTALRGQDDEGGLLTSCNGAKIVSPGDAVIIQDLINGQHLLSGIRCHFVKETRMPSENLITYSGYSPTAVHTFVRSFQESGILDMFFKFKEYIQFLPFRTRIEKKRSADERAEVPFQLQDPKNPLHLHRLGRSARRSISRFPRRVFPQPSHLPLLHCIRTNELRLHLIH
jgi:hypothetical protein